MAYFQTISYTNAATQASVNLDPAIVPFNASVGCTLVAGTVSYKLQFSLDPMTVTDANALWFDSGDMPAATAASASTGFVTPVSRVRVVIASLVTGPLTLQVLQGFSTN